MVYEEPVPGRIDFNGQITGGQNKCVPDIYFTQQLRLVDLPILIPPLIYPVLLLSNSLSPFFPDLFDSLSSSFNAEQWRSIFIPSR